MRGLARGTVALQAHQTEWEQEAARTIRLLADLLGPAASDIQHVGSTAIPAIQAKPILDIAVATADFTAVEACRPALEKAGYRQSTNAVGDELLFGAGDFAANTRTQHIHVVKAGSRRFTDFVNFRDYLNSRPETAKAYEALKCRLAQEFPDNRAAYTAGKAAWIAAVLRRAYAWSFLGRTVHVVVDRPLGSTHPQYPGTVYPVNYGYIPDTLSGDDEALDAYILGVEQPVSAFTGRVIAVVYREDDAEDKLVAAPEGQYLDRAEIAAAIAFMEKYYHSELECLEES